MDDNPDKQGVIFTEGSGYCQEGDLVNDCTPPHGAVMCQSGPLPYDTVHPRFLHYATVTRTQHLAFNRKYSNIERNIFGYLTWHLTV